MQIRTLSSERDPRKIKNSQIMTQEPFTNVSRKPRKNLQVQSKIVLSTNNHASRAGFSWCTKIVHRKKSVSFNKVSCTSRTWNQHTWTFETRTLETNTPHSMRKNQRSVRISHGASHTSYSCSTALGREPFRPIQFRPLHGIKNSEPHLIKDRPLQRSARPPPGAGQSTSSASDAEADTTGYPRTPTHI